MLGQIEESDTKGGIIIPKDKFKEFVEVQKRRVEGKLRRVHPEGGICEPCSDIRKLYERQSAKTTSENIEINNLNPALTITYKTRIMREG